MRLWNHIQYLVLLILSKIVGLFPRRLLYQVAVPGLYFIIYHLVKYRKIVVRTNLENSFPEKSTEERLCIEKQFYRHLSEVFLDTFRIGGISATRLQDAMHYVNSETVEAETAGKSWICAMAHYGSWEYMVNYKLFSKHDVIAVYRPLSSQGVDRFYHRIRARFGVRPVPMHSIAREISRAQLPGARPLSIALIADQTPPYREIKDWFPFLNQNTPFFMGMEKLALHYKLPVYLLRVKKLAPGTYLGNFQKIYDGLEEVAPLEITRRYAEAIEEMIRETPELWMWSHQRWKHQRNKPFNRKKHKFKRK